MSSVSSTALGTPLDSAHLDQLIADHQAGIWRYLRYLGANDNLAEDLLQETFVAVWNKPFELRDPASTRRYLCTVARNLFLMAKRRGRAHSHFDDLDEADAAWHQLAADGGQEYIDSLRQCLDELTERSRQAIQLQYYDGQPRQVIGARLGVSTEGVKTLMRRTREQLRECVERRLQQ